MLSNNATVTTSSDLMVGWGLIKQEMKKAFLFLMANKDIFLIFTASGFDSCLDLTALVRRRAGVKSTTGYRTDGQEHARADMAQFSSHILDDLVLYSFFLHASITLNYGFIPLYSRA